MVLLASLNAETFPPNITANLGTGREKNNKKRLSRAVRVVQLARGGTASLLFHAGWDIRFTLALMQCATPYPAQMIDCILAKPNGSPSLISLLWSHMWDDTDGQRAPSCTDAQSLFLAGMIKVKLMSEAIVLDHIALALFSPVITASGISGRFLISG